MFASIFLIKHTIFQYYVNALYMNIEIGTLV